MLTDFPFNNMNYYFSNKMAVLIVLFLVIFNGDALALHLYLFLTYNALCFILSISLLKIRLCSFNPLCCVRNGNHSSPLFAEDNENPLYTNSKILCLVHEIS